MADDIVERLCCAVAESVQNVELAKLIDEATDEIERLRYENEWLRAAGDNLHRSLEILVSNVPAFSDSELTMRQWKEACNA